MKVKIIFLLKKENVDNLKSIEKNFIVLSNIGCNVKRKQKFKIVFWL